MTLATPTATFRDPAGSLSFQGNVAVRTIGPAARESVLEFLNSPFCQRAQLRGDLIPADIDDTPEALRLTHPRISIPTYPWEWTPTQWLAAANLTLNLCEEALADGWILKDATPLNVLFTATRPIFVDILSFERRDPTSSLWLAYGQYVRTFLLPLLMNRLLSWPLALTLFKRDGYEPTDLYAALTWRQRLSRAAFWPITVPTLLDRRKPADSPAKKLTPRPQTPEIATAVLQRAVTKLRRQTQRAVAATSSSDWSEYQATLTHYTPEQSREKLAWVRQTLESTTPESTTQTVLDIGANTGEFSALAASLGAKVTALERDQTSADRLFTMARDRSLSIQTIHADIARPTPAVGWENSESPALIPRLEGHFDLVLMLAVIHHLILMEQIPIPAILALCHRLTRRHLVVEWVPVEDPMFQSLMRDRDSLYAHLTEADLLAACAGLFQTLTRQPLENGRILFLFEKITAKIGTID
jgi:2-polyprenyl-3-methyl-5-hydroxy-6-metoxy-1,4-benzoquinol methylase